MIKYLRFLVRLRSSVSVVVLLVFLAACNQQESKDSVAKEFVQPSSDTRIAPLILQMTTVDALPISVNTSYILQGDSGTLSASYQGLICRKMISRWQDEVTNVYLDSLGAPFFVSIASESTSEKTAYYVSPSSGSLIAVLRSVGSEKWSSVAIDSAMYELLDQKVQFYTSQLVSKTRHTHVLPQLKPKTITDKAKAVLEQTCVIQGFQTQDFKVPTIKGQKWVVTLDSDNKNTVFIVQENGMGGEELSSETRHWNGVSTIEGHLYVRIFHPLSEAKRNGISHCKVQFVKQD